MIELQRQGCEWPLAIIENIQKLWKSFFPYIFGSQMHFVAKSNWNSCKVFISLTWGQHSDICHRDTMKLDDCRAPVSPMRVTIHKVLARCQKDSSPIQPAQMYEEETVSLYNSSRNWYWTKTSLIFAIPLLISCFSTAAQHLYCMSDSHTLFSLNDIVFKEIPYPQYKQKTSLSSQCRKEWKG